MIEIKLTDLPEFDKQLKITITLEKDEDGIKESITTSPGTSSLGPESSTDPTPLAKKRTKKVDETKTLDRKETGDGIEKSSVVNESPATFTQTLTSPSNPEVAKPRRRSGNMMGLEI